MSVSAARYYFVIVNYQDVPIYEVDFSVANRNEVQVSERNLADYGTG